MDFLELVRSRYSVRSYQPRPVEQDKLDRILEAVRLAPSGSNRQPWKFVVVRDEEVRRRWWQPAATSSTSPRPRW